MNKKHFHIQDKQLISPSQALDIYLVLHIYSDNDKSDYENMKVINNPLNNCWIDKAYIHRNTFEYEKDFGVPKERIKESYIQAK